MHRKRVERPFVHDHESFLQVLTLLALITSIFERQVTAKLGRVLDRNTFFLGRRQSEKQLRPIHEIIERGRRHAVIAHVHETHVLAGASNCIDGFALATAFAADKRTDIYNRYLREIQDAGCGHDHVGILRNLGFKM